MSPAGGPGRPRSSGGVIDPPLSGRRRPPDNHISGRGQRYLRDDRDPGGRPDRLHPRPSSCRDRRRGRGARGSPRLRRALPVGHGGGVHLRPRRLAHHLLARRGGPRLDARGPRGEPGGPAPRDEVPLPGPVRAVPVRERPRGPSARRPVPLRRRLRPGGDRIRARRAGSGPLLSRLDLPDLRRRDRGLLPGPVQREIWKYPLDEMSAHWVDGRVPRPPLADVLRSACGVPTERYAHQAVFWYPASGGIESMVHAIAAPNRGPGSAAASASARSGTREAVSESRTGRRRSRPTAASRQSRSRPFSRPSTTSRMQ